MMMNLKRWRKIKYLSFIMDIIHMNMYPSWVTIPYKPEHPSKYMSNREFSSGRISLHRCSWEKWYDNIDSTGWIPRDSIKKSNLSKKIIYITKIPNISNLFSWNIFFFLEKYPWPTIWKFLESDYFYISNFSSEIRKMRMNKVHRHNTKQKIRNKYQEKRAKSWVFF